MISLLKAIQLFGNSIIGFLISLLIGSIAGLVTCQFTRAKDLDVVLSVLLGIAGALLASYVAGALGFSTFGQYGDHLAAAVGAIIFLLGWHRMRGIR